MEQKKEPVVPIGEKYTLTLREASVYFGIGEKKIWIGYNKLDRKHLAMI